MKLRNVGAYNIGLDIGTSSVGWAATDEEGNLLYHKGQPTWGSRLFPEAEKAADARMQRGLRRRYARRRWRLDLLQGIFAEEMEGIDPEFFVRLNQARLHPDDRDPAHADYRWPLFNDEGFDEKAYYKRFPTIYHLRAWLMETEEKADIRLIYLALHNIVKHRGNFLQQEMKDLTSENASIDDSVALLCDALAEWCEQHGIDCTAPDHVGQIVEAMKNGGKGKSALKEQIWPALGIQPGDEIDKKGATGLAKAIAGAIVGACAEMASIFFVFDEKPADVTTKIYLSNDEQADAFSEACPDDGRPLFEAMNAAYSAFVLQEVLSARPGQPISVNKVEEYERYGEDLKLLKDLVKQYAPEDYDGFFRGPTFEKLYPGEKQKYDPTRAEGYTRYDIIRKAPYDDFKKSVEKVFKGTAAIEDERYAKMMDGFERQRFLRRLKTSDNGSIPYQLHLEEMDRIIENQAAYYPFLGEKKRELDSLVSFRIPYYVGPLTQKNARRENDRKDGALRFAWSERYPGKENEAVYPWNWDEVIDKDASAESFIRRMTGTCTYLQGAPVLPKCSLLYEEFCVLNELNGAHFTQDGDRDRRFDYQDRIGLMDDLFKNGSVTYQKVEKWMAENRGMRVHVSGGQGERGFESRLSSYVFFKKDIFQVDEIPEADYPMIEKIILWNTIFEDRDILRRKLRAEFGDRLDERQIKRICQKRFTGWGRLSEELLTGIKAQTDDGPRSIMDVLREGDPTNGHGSRAMVLMEALRDDRLRFQELVDEANAKRLGDLSAIDLEDLPGSPALRRGINQAMLIVEEIARIAGHAPANIFVEVTRSDDERKGTRTRRRYDDLKEHLAAFKRESGEFWDERLKDELASKSHGDLDEKLTLYFMQGGKSLYSGKPLDINRLSEYEVDHIIPQSYIKDDSFENKALVLKEENQRKSDQMLLPSDMRREMGPYWRALFHAKLIGEKKHRNLMRSEVTDKQLKGFINRQIVETSQIVKMVKMMLEATYPETDVVPIKAGLTHELREGGNRRKGEGPLFPKCREANDFHHAHDALLACEIGRFIKLRFPEMHEHPLRYQHAVRSFVKREKERVSHGHNPFGSTFIISSFMRSGFDEETGEVADGGDAWNAPEELAKIRRFLNYRQCFITRMPREDTGAFWDDTIYSPHDPKKKDQLKLPLKKGLDPRRYGSFSREQFAYFFIYEGIKKGKRTLAFAPVPVSIAASLVANASALEEHARQLADEGGVEFSRIVRSKIYKDQLIELEGSRLYITGKEEVRNGREVALDLEGLDIVRRIVDESAAHACGPLSDEELAEAFLWISASLSRYSPRLAKAVSIGAWDDAFYAASHADKEHVIRELLAIASAKKNAIDLTSVGKSKYSGQMGITFSKELNGSGICFIDQSVTGMFERRTHIGL